jgi:predicted MFS family arabinose efflux permease
MLIALAGVALTGFGYSLVYPGLGVEAIRRAPTQSRGLAMGTYTAFLDLSLGLSSPLLGLIAIAGGLNSVYLWSAIIVTGSAAVAILLWRSPWHQLMPFPSA